MGGPLTRMYRTIRWLMRIVNLTNRGPRLGGSRGGAWLRCLVGVARAVVRPRVVPMLAQSHAEGTPGQGSVLQWQWMWV